MLDGESSPHRLECMDQGPVEAGGECSNRLGAFEENGISWDIALVAVSAAAGGEVVIPIDWAVWLEVADPIESRLMACRRVVAAEPAGVQESFPS